MKVKVKELSAEIELKNNGIELQVCNSENKQVGDLYISRGGVTWCQGKTKRENGVKMSWDKFIAKMNEHK